MCKSTKQSVNQEDFYMPAVHVKEIKQTTLPASVAVTNKMVTSFSRNEYLLLFNAADVQKD